MIVGYFLWFANKFYITVPGCVFALPRSRTHHWEDGGELALFAFHSFTLRESRYSVTPVIFNAPSPSLAKLKRSKISCVNGSPGKLRVTFACWDELMSALVELLELKPADLNNNEQGMLDDFDEFQLESNHQS
jgi:hypothetical protein